MRLLDLYSGAGGAAAGYVRAGFTVVGVDIKPQPRYRHSGAVAFIQADALEYCREHGHEFDAIHASPPCQGYSRTRFLPWLKGRKHPLLIEPTRAELRKLSCPWVIENVGDSPLKGVALHGAMFGLPFVRERIFESNIVLFAPSKKRRAVGVPGRMFGNRLRKQHGQVGDDQAIPPEYSEWIGKQLMAVLASRAKETA